MFFVGKRSGYKTLRTKILVTGLDFLSKHFQTWINWKISQFEHWENTALWAFSPLGNQANVCFNGADVLSLNAAIILFPRPPLWDKADAGLFASCSLKKLPQGAGTPGAIHFFQSSQLLKCTCAVVLFLYAKCKMAFSEWIPFVPHTTCQGFERGQTWAIISDSQKNIAPLDGGIICYHKRKTWMTSHRPRLSWGGGSGQ